jgi:hypothetical protein
LTKLVPENYRLFSEVRQYLIDADHPEARAAWDTAINTEKQAREDLRAKGGSISRHTGQGLIPPLSGTSLEQAINSAMAHRDEIIRHVDEKIRDGLRSGVLVPLTTAGTRIVHADWRGDFDSDYVDIQGKREFVCFDRANVESFISRLFNLPMFEKLTPKQRIVVEYLRKHHPDMNFGHLGRLRHRIIESCPALHGSLDPTTFLEARKFFKSCPR